MGNRTIESTVSAQLAQAHVRLRPGDVVADRFVIDGLAGSGGMGVVYRANDRETGRRAAVKVMESSEVERFELEAAVLAELAHPAIVRYLAHGTHEARRFLAMEWLEGEDLHVRLRRAPLAVGECIAIMRRVSEGLAVAHARKIVHRDIKPANLMLVDGEPSLVKLVDFGIARSARRTDLTRTGALIGTVGYMAPEQARGAADIDVRADIFSLGCVLFECLSGHAAFTGDHAVAILAKLLGDEAPRLQALRPDLPPDLDDLVGRMLAKDRDRRPADATALGRELAELGPITARHAPLRRSEPRMAAEQRMVSVILAKIEETALAATLPGNRDAFAMRSDVLEAAARQSDALANMLAPFGASFVHLVDGSLLVTLAGAGAAKDRASVAASCALVLRAGYPEARIALATGRLESAARTMGAAIDRAARLLGVAVSGAIAIDDVTAGLLDERFEIERGLLVGRRDREAGARRLLGKPTPCIGRDRELALLGATFDECVAEPVARAVVVTAAPGVGKSRLRFELIARLADRATVLTARADPMSNATLGLVRQLVDGADLAKHEFLAELAGVPPTDPSPLLRAARNDARVMSEWLRRSFVDWLAAECTAKPVVVVLEDLHWGDHQSVKYIEAALRELDEQPLLLLAFARPEVGNHFPSAQRIHLAGLARRAAERLVDVVLGSAVSAEARGKIVARADGNAYYLEELIRHVAANVGHDLPETVLAMVQSRLDHLEPEARRVLRAGSVFGETFWSGGVAALVDDSVDANAWLRTLADREVLVARPTSRFPGEDEYEFRHGLLREGAYASLAEADRAPGHHHAAEWLVHTGEIDPTIIADHYANGSEPACAIPWLAQASKDAVDVGNFDACHTRAERGLALGATGEMRGTLLGLSGWSTQLRGATIVDTRASLAESLELLPAETTPWLTAAVGLVNLSFQLEDPSAVLHVLRRMTTSTLPPQATGPYARLISLLVQVTLNLGQNELARTLVARLDAAAATDHAEDPAFDGWLHLTHLRLAALADGNLGGALDHGRKAMAILATTADAWSVSYAGMEAAWIQLDTGDLERTVALLLEARIGAEKVASPMVAGWCTVWLAKVNAYAGDPLQAIELVDEFTKSSTNRLLVHSARAVLAHAYLGAGRHDDAIKLATEVLASPMVSVKSICLAALARAELESGRAAEALRHADAWFALRRDPFEVRIEGSIVRIARAEAQAALGLVDDARATILDARARIARIAESLDTSDRTAYLALDANVRTLTFEA